MGVITGYTRRTAAIGSGGGGGAINTIYSASDTIIDDARTVTLKTGTTASQNLQILNSAGANLYTGRGDNKVVFGSSSIGLSIDKYLNNSIVNDTYINNVLYKKLTTSGRYETYYNASGSAKLEIDSIGEIRLYSGRFQIYNSLSNLVSDLSIGGNIPTQLYADSTGTNSIQLYGGSGTSIVAKYSAVIGKWANSSGPQFEVFGSGATSATTTAAFKNSASVSALKVKDDLYCIFRAKDAVIPDGDLSNNELSFYIEEATNDLHFKVKYSTGTVKSGKINLT